MIRIAKRLAPAAMVFLFLTASLSNAQEMGLIQNDYGLTLQTHVSQGRVDYKRLATNRGPLDQYLKKAASVDRSRFEKWGPAHQLSFFINLYNAATLALIIDHYPVKSIKDIGGLFSNPWKRRVVRLFGEKISLDHLEHEIIRKNYPDPRVHVALVCAAAGCPVLRPSPYSGERLNEQLDEQMKIFMMDPVKNRIDAPRRTLHLSPIFKWYRSDFLEKTSLAKYLAPYWPNAEKITPGEMETYRIEFTHYDWSLNKKSRD